jgi:diadenosine tetraphosphate (Ap4A) HIT family hydrolase
MDKPAWPADWDDRKAGRDCPMCATRGHLDNGYGLRVHHGSFADLYLNRAPQRGYVVAIWNGPHVAEPTQLDDQQATGFFREVLAAGRAVEILFQPVKINYETLGNTLPHLHTHVIPRYADDPAPGALLPSELLEQRQKPSRQFAADAAALEVHFS